MERRDFEKTLFYDVKSNSFSPFFNQQMEVIILKIGILEKSIFRWRVHYSLLSKTNPHFQLLRLFLQSKIWNFWDWLCWSLIIHAYLKPFFFLKKVHQTGLSVMIHTLELMQNFIFKSYSIIWLADLLSKLELKHKPYLSGGSSLV